MRSRDGVVGASDAILHQRPEALDGLGVDVAVHVEVERFLSFNVGSGCRAT
jgi:hypothetical protein